MKKIKPPTAYRIQTLRLQAGYSQEQLAEKVNVSLDTVKAWENGRRTPTGKNIEKLCRVLHTKEEYILNGDTSFDQLISQWDKENTPSIKFIQLATSLGFFQYSDLDDAEVNEKDEQNYIEYNRLYEERKKKIMKKEEIKVVLHSAENRIIENFETGEIIVHAKSEADLEKAYQHLINRGIIENG